MDSLLAAADNLDDLLDELEKNEGEQVQSLQKTEVDIEKLKSTTVSSTTNATPDETSSQLINGSSMTDNSDTANIINVQSAEKINEEVDSAETQFQNCDNLIAMSEKFMEESLNVEDSTTVDASSQPSPDTFVNLFGVLPNSSVKSDNEATTKLFSPLNPFSASYTGPITGFDGENIFPKAKIVSDGDIMEASVSNNPFEYNGNKIAGENEASAVTSDYASSMSPDPVVINTFNGFREETSVQSSGVGNHVESLSNLSGTPASKSCTSELLQHTDHTTNATEQELPSLSVNALLNESVSAIPGTAKQNFQEISPVTVDLTHESAVNSQPQRQEMTSMGFMRDLEISKEEFDQFWEEVEDDTSEESSRLESNNVTTLRTSLPHEQAPLDPVPAFSTSLSNVGDCENAKFEPTEESVVFNAQDDPHGAATAIVSAVATVDHVSSNANLPPDLLVEVPSVGTNELLDTTDGSAASSEVIASPVSVPYIPDHVSPRGSPTFPLQRKAVSHVTEAEASSSEHLQSDENRLSLNVNVPVEGNVDLQHCYPATPPPPYSEEMHINYERTISPTSAATSGQPSSAGQLQREAEDSALLAIMESITRPGETKPIWVPDQDAPQCSNCAQKFTFTKRRHHCRACGRVFCANCCSERAQLKYLEYKEARVCLMCYLAIKQADAVAVQISQQRSQNRAVNNEPVPRQEIVDPVQPVDFSPNSNTTSGEMTQNQTAITPVQSLIAAGQTSNEVPSQEDLEVEGATAATAATVKSVRFSDGTRPTHPDEAPTTPPPPTRTNRLRKRHGAAIDQTNFDSTTLPPAIIAHGEDGTFAVQNNPDSNVLLGLLESGIQNPQTFVLNPNLFVHVKFVSHANRQCWCYWSEGMDCVGQREIVLVLDRQGLGDRQISSDAFMFYKHIFDRARKGKIFNTSDYMPKSVMGVAEDGEIFNLDRNAGFLFVQATSQPLEGFSCLKKKLYWHSVSDASNNSQLDQPINGMLFAILVQKTEASLATLFPLRLMLRLGIETKQYPCPLFSIRQRDPVFQEIGHTILAILCDFNNFKYRIIGVPGIRVVLSSNGHISVQIPSNRFRDTIRIMNSSNESVLAIGTGTYGPKLNEANSDSSTDAPCDSHLVCVQDQETTSYHTEISSMKNVKPMNTGAAFVIFNGSLKSDGSHSAKCAIVEDGIMIQLLPEKMEELRSCLKSMEDFSVPLAANSQSIPDQNTSENNHLEQLFLEVKWVDNDTAFNIGMFSPIDGTPFEGVVGFNVQGRSEQKGKKYILRWNQVFFLASTGNPLDLSRLAEQVANGCFLAFTPVIQELVKHRLKKIGVRVTIHPENVGYIAGGGQKDLPSSCMNSLDEYLIQTIHSAANSVPVEQEAVVFELLFSVLLTKPSYRTA